MDYGEIEDDSWLESEIQRELDAVNLEDDASLRNGEEPGPVDDVSDDDDDDADIIIGEKLPDAISPTMQDYLQRYQGQTSYVEQELLDCDSLISQIEQKIVAQNVSAPDEYLLNAAKEKGKDPIKLRKEILEQLDKEDEEELERETAETDTEKSEDVEEAAFMTETGEVAPKKPAVSPNTEEAIAPGDGVMVVFTEADELERQFHQQMEEWLSKQQKKENDRKSESDKRLEGFRLRIQESEEKRKQTLENLDEEGKKLTEQRKAEEARFRELAEAQKQRFQQSFVNFEAQIEALSAEVKKEQDLHEHISREAEERVNERRQKAAIKIQAHFRRFSVLKQHGATVQHWIAQRREEIMEEKLMKAEVSIRKRKEREKKEEHVKEELEQERLLRETAENKLKEEKERKKKLELEEQKKRVEAEKKRNEEEKKVRDEEEQKRKEAEKLKMEEEKRLKEEEEKRKQEEEKRMKEDEKKRKEEEKKRKAEELRLKKDEEKRKREEEKRKREEENRIKEEEKRKKAEEEKRSQEMEQKRREAERLVKEEEEKKKEAERLAKEEEERRKEAERLAKVEEEKIKEAKKLAEEKKNEAERLAKEKEKKKEPENAEEMKLKELKEKKEKMHKAAEEERKEKLSAMMKKREEMMEEPSTPSGPNLEELLQQKRLAWMQMCTPWSKISMEMKSRRTPVSKRPSRRPSSAKSLQNLPENVILSAAEVNSLSEVTTVELCDLPGYSVTPLGSCQNLQYLSMTNCNLVTLDGLSACSRLAVLECQNNKIEMINLAKLDSLLYVDLSSNNLTSIHGLDSCKDIRYLNLSSNRITRISSIGHCPLLHTLILSHNQLIRTQNLNEAPTVQVLDLSHNNLQSLDDLEKLGMLRKLDASSNNILEFPSLTNQVLLEELLLDDNSVSSFGNLSDCWLPLLHHLSINQNSLTSLEDMGGCFLLKKLNVGNNQITDLACILKAFSSLPRLEHIWLSGNPITELNKQFKSKVISECHTLQYIDDEKVPERGKMHPKPSSYETMCQQQYQLNQGLWENYQKHIRSVAGENADLAIVLHQDYFDKSNKIVTDNRYCHEYGEIKSESSVILDNFSKQLTKTGSSEGSRRVETKKIQREMDDASVCSSSSRRSIDKSKIDLQSESGSNRLDSKAKFDAMLSSGYKPKSRDSSRISQLQTNGEKNHSKTKFEEALIGAGMAENVSSSVQKPQTLMSETSSGYSDSKSKFDAMLQGAQKPEADRTRGNHPNSSSSQSVVQNALSKARLDNAATAIQALWRGYSLRKQIQNAYQFARMNGLEEEDDLFGEEVDLSAFDLNEDDFDKDWVPSENPEIPMNHAVLKANNTTGDFRPHPPSAPKHAWKDGHGLGKPPLPPSSAMSGHDTQRTWQSKKEEKISEECFSTPRTSRSQKEDELMHSWGFKDSKTAELMMQRAKKLKYNALRKKKLSQLDPQQRLELMRKLEESNRASPVQPPKRPAANRKEYFKAKEDEIRHKEHDKQEEMKNKAARMYEWLHEAVQDDMSSVGTTPQPSNGSSALFRARNHGSDGNLPRLTPELIAGGRVNLTGSPSLELQSVDGSHVESEKNRRYSVGETHTVLGQTQFPPIKINSAPNSASSKKGEKMSWRGPEVNQSIGWGGGKKRPAHKT